MKRTALVSIAAVTFVFTTWASSSHALEESTRRPFYVQGTIGSVGLWTGFAFGDQAYWHPDIELGYHFTGRHDGLVLALRQGFDVGRYAIGQTVLRAGYDIAVPFRNGRFEITLAPFATIGANYFFDNGVQAGVHLSLGAEGKLFFFRGLYLLVRPIEVSLGEFVNLGLFVKNVYFNLNAGIGAGFAF